MKIELTEEAVNITTPLIQKLKEFKHCKATDNE